MASEAQRTADARYKAAHTKQIKLVLNRNTEAELLSFLTAKDNVQGYIKALIRSDMQKTRQE